MVLAQVPAKMIVAVVLMTPLLTYTVTLQELVYHAVILVMVVIQLVEVVVKEAV